MNLNNYSPRTLKDIQQTVKKYLAYLEEEQIEEPTYNDVFSYVGSMKVSTRVKRIRTRHIWIYHDQNTETNPAEGIKFRTEQKTITESLTSEELDKKYKDFATRKLDIRTKEETQLRYCVLLGLVIYQAVSTKELQKLQVSDINLFDGTIRITQSERTNERELLLNPVQMLPLSKYIENRKGRLFDQEITGMFTQMNKYIKGISKLRSARIVCWIKEHPIRKVQYLTGMKYLSSLDNYKSHNVEGLREKVERFHLL